MVLVGVGSNQGQSLDIVLAAMARLEEYALCGTFRCSRLYETSPVDCPPDAGIFINGVVGFEAVEGLTAEALLIALKALEREYGRTQTLQRNAPRELDLDLLVFNDEQRCTEYFTLPHPRATQRLFVMAPANEVAPQLVWPGMGDMVATLLENLETDEEVSPLAQPTCSSRC